MTLTELADQYNCDKLFNHSYIDFYEELFAERPVKKLLEIGIGYAELMTPFVPKYVHGASLLMWRDYFPNAVIYSCDIREDTLFQSDRIHTMQCDQTSWESVRRMLVQFGTDFDVVIDDGSHDVEHQIMTARMICPLLKPGAIYIIEDVQQPEVTFMALVGMARKFDSEEPIQVHQFGKRPDDNLVVIRR